MENNSNSNVELMSKLTERIKSNTMDTWAFKGLNSERHNHNSNILDRFYSSISIPKVHDFQTVSIMRVLEKAWGVRGRGLNLALLLSGTGTDLKCTRLKVNGKQPHQPAISPSRAGLKPVSGIVIHLHDTLGTFSPHSGRKYLLSLLHADHVLDAYNLQTSKEGS